MRDLRAAVFVAVAVSIALAGLLIDAGDTDASKQTGIHKIKHVVIIMQENRSFDSYFGTYPGADGIPMNRHGNPKVCVPDPSAGICWRPYHDPRVRTGGGPHGAGNSRRDINGGKMDGFIE